MIHPEESAQSSDKQLTFADCKLIAWKRLGGERGSSNAQEPFVTLYAVLFWGTSGEQFPKGKRGTVAEKR